MTLKINDKLIREIAQKYSELVKKYPLEDEDILVDRATKHLARTRPELFDPDHLIEGLYLQLVAEEEGN